MSEIHFSTSAEREYEQVWDWYASQNIRAAENFKKELERVVEEIAEDPLRYPKLDRTYRFCKLQGFPYVIFYRQMKMHIAVVALAHTSRQPGYWKATGENQP